MRQRGIDLLHIFVHSPFMSSRTRLSFSSLAILGISLIACMALRLNAARSVPPAAHAAPHTAAAWLQQAQSHHSAQRHADALRACRAGLLLEPWNSGLCLQMTQSLLEQADADALKDWMDELVLGDARLAEQTFQLPAFRPWLEQSAFQTLYQEARFQARD